MNTINSSRFLGLCGLALLGACATSDPTETTGQALIGGTVVDVQVASRHACSLLANRTVQCWGDNSVGQLGDGTTTPHLTPATVPGLSNVTAIDVGGFVTLYSGGYAFTDFSCALEGDGSVWCWGDDQFGQLGIGKPAAYQTRPVRVPIGNAVQVATGGAHACALISDGTVQCWGFNTDGQVGYGGRGLEWDTPIVVGHDTGVLRNVASVVTGARNSCAILTDRSVRCWGNNYYGSSLFGYGHGLPLSDPNLLAYSPQPTHIPAVSELSLGGLGGGGLDDYENGNLQIGQDGGDFGCAKLLDSTVWCWGSNYRGQIGNGSTDWGPSGDITDPTILDGSAANGTNLRGLAMGGDFAFGIRDDGALVAWGAVDGGALADGNTSYDNKSCRENGGNCRAHPIATQGAFLTASAGGLSSCGLRTDGSVSCWGSNVWGAIGDGTYNTPAQPVTIYTASAAPHVAAVTASDYTTHVHPWSTVVLWGSQFGDWDGQVNDQAAVLVRQGGATWRLGLGAANWYGSTGQINVAMPDGVSPGTAAIAMQRADGSISNEVVVGIE